MRDRCRQMLFSCREQNGRDECWPTEARDFGQTIDDIERGRPGLVGRICRWPLLNVFRAAFQDEAAVACGKAISVKDESMQKLTTGEWHKHPASHPVRLASLAPNILLFCSIVCKLKRPTEGIDGDADAQLRGRADAQEESGQCCTNGRCVSRSQPKTDARITTAEGTSRGLE